MIFWEKILSAAVTAAFLLTLLFAAVTDYRERIIHNGCHIVIFILGTAALWLFPERTLAAKCIGIAAVSLPMLALTLLIPGAFGGGDIKLVVACGWMLGWQGVVCGFAVAVLCGGAVEGVRLVQKKTDRKDSFAFGPYLAVGMAVAWFGADWLINWFWQ